jgi:hypothetical protein
VLVGAPLSFESFPLSYLWFLYYLLLIYAVISALRAAVARFDGGGRIVAVADRVVRELFKGRWAAPLVLMIPFSTGLLGEKSYATFSGLGTPNSSLIPQIIPLLEYGIAFSFGWLLQRNADLLDVLRERWARYLLAAACATIVAAVSPLPIVLRSSPEVVAFGRTLFGFAYAFASWCWTLGITAFALRALSSESATRRYVADASYWVYLVHYTLVLALEDVLSPIHLHWIFKFSLIFGVTMAIALVSYHYLVRFTVIGWVLNGRRRKRADEPGLRSALV